MGKTIRMRVMVILTAAVFALALFSVLGRETWADEPVPLDLTEGESRSGHGWEWDKEKATLTLNGFALDLSTRTEDYAEAIKLPENAVVVLQGEGNTITLKGVTQSAYPEPRIGIHGTGDLTIYGTGRLDVEAADGAVGIYSEGNLTLGTEEKKVDITAYGTDLAIGAMETVTVQKADIEAGAVSAEGVIFAKNESKAETAITVANSDLALSAEGANSNGLGAYYGNIFLTKSSLSQTPGTEASGTAGISARNGSVLLDNVEALIDLSEEEASMGIEATNMDFEQVEPGIEIKNSELNLASDDSALSAYFGGIQIVNSTVKAKANLYCADAGRAGMQISGGSDVSLISNGGYMSAGARISNGQDGNGGLSVTGSKLHCEGNGDKGIGLIVNCDGKAVFKGATTQISLTGDAYAFQMSGDAATFTKNPLTLEDGLSELTGNQFLSAVDTENDMLWSFTADEELEVDEDGSLANAADEVYIGIQTEMTINIKGEQKTVDYDGEEHVVEKVTAESPDHPELFDQELLAAHVKMKLKETEPGEYFMGMKEDDYEYMDPFVKATIVVEDGFLKINAPTDGPAVKTQPVDVNVNYPAGATFLVEAEDPDSVESYQWMATDGFHWFTLDGITAHEPKLIIPSTEQDDPDMIYRCRLKGTDGKFSYSEPASLKVMNKNENKTVLYVGNYALLPGQGMDLSYTQEELGSGTVTFDENGSDIILSNVELDNSTMLYDSTLSPALGINLSREGNQKEVYNVILKGENTITNHFYQESSNSGGIDFQVMMMGEDAVHPEIFMKGDGSLTLNGGSYGMYLDGSLILDVPVTTVPNGDLFMDGIHAESIMVEEGIQLDLDVNGGGLIAETDNGLAVTQLKEGSEVRIHSSAPHVSGADTEKYAIFTASLYMTEAKLTIEADADPKQFVPYGQHLSSFGGIFINAYGNMEVYDSSVQINMKAAESETPYIGSYYGIGGYYPEEILFDHSDVAITINSDQITNASGIYTNSGLTVNESKVKNEIAAGSRVYGIAPEGEFSVTDSQIENNCKALIAGGDCYGVLCGNLVLKDTKKGYLFKSTAEKGVALAANTDQTGLEPKTYDPSYKAKKYKIGGAAVTVPASSAISTASMLSGDGEYLYLEAVYDKKDTSVPASSVVIEGKNPISAAKATLQYQNTVYNGKAKTPAVTVKFGSKTLKKGSDYTIAYSNNKNVGTAIVTITGKGDFTGTVKKTFKINPKGTSIKSVTGGTKSLTVKWKKQKKQTSGYQIQYSTKKSVKSGKIVTVKKNKTTEKTIRKLKANKTYYVRVRTFKTVKGKKYYSAWSAVKIAKTK